MSKKVKSNVEKRQLEKYAGHGSFYAYFDILNNF